MMGKQPAKAFRERIKFSKNFDHSRAKVSNFSKIKSGVIRVTHKISRKNACWKYERKIFSLVFAIGSYRLILLFSWNYLISIMGLKSQAHSTPKKKLYSHEKWRHDTFFFFVVLCKNMIFSWWNFNSRDKPVYYYLKCPSLLHSVS